MKYVSLDLETTGLDPRKDQVIQIGAVFEDTDDIKPLDELPAFECLIAHPRVEGGWFAINMNRDLLARAQTNEGVLPQAAWEKFIGWLRSVNPVAFDQGAIVAAGKNVGSFDMQFLPGYVRGCFDHRYIDPGSVFIDWGKPKIQSLSTMLGEKVEHTALADAKAVVQVLRKAYT